MIFKIFKEKKEAQNEKLEVFASLTGRVLDIENVPDEVFSKKMLGDGIAIEPSEGELTSPFDGKVKQVFSTGHALVLESRGIPFLIHVGIDTVKLKGEGFRLYVNEGDAVKKGQLLLTFDKELIFNKGFSLITPVIIPDMKRVKGIIKTDKKNVIKGVDVLLEVIL
ncbi:MAG: PTS sugar transporter subunit IIA [Thermovenabulum sp.]|uniref:PTS sugar transporter subunit IIA n=1 Tax=Thermovenabulum sp. TaxID=3100335 RepID=UPI003C7DA520